MGDLDEIEMEKLPRVKPEMYWEWRTTIEEMDHAKTKFNLCKANAELLRRETENAALRHQLHLKTKIVESESLVDAAKKEYDNMKCKIEKDLGFSLENKMIDDLTYEVKDIPKEG